jgi:hypothetical protein
MTARMAAAFEKSEFGPAASKSECAPIAAAKAKGPRMTANADAERPNDFERIPWIIVVVPPLP